MSAAADGTVWSLDSSNNIYSYNGSGWQLMPGILHQVSVGSAKNAWGVTSAATIWRWNGSTWTQVSGPPSSTPKQVSVAMDGTVWCLDTTNNMFSYTGSG